MSKNDPTKRGKTLNGKMYNGKLVKPFKYIGKYVGHGTFFGARYEDGSIVSDANGVPVAWDQI